MYGYTSPTSLSTSNEHSRKYSNNSFKKNRYIITQTTTDITIKPITNWKDKLDKLIKEVNTKISLKEENKNKENKDIISDTVNKTLNKFQVKPNMIKTIQTTMNAT